MANEVKSDEKYCYISTTTSQSSSSSNYQNIPYRMPTTTPVIYQGSSIAPLNYMPIAIWSTMPVFKTSVYYSNGTNTVEYPTSDSGLLSMNQASGPVLFGNGAGESGTPSGSKATPFFGRYQEWYGEIRDNWQVYTGYMGGESVSYHCPPSAPIYAAANYRVDDSTYTGAVIVDVYNYAEYSAQVYIKLYAGSTVKHTSSTVTASAMTIRSNKLKPGVKSFSISLRSASDVRAITNIKVYWYSKNGNLIVYTYPVSFNLSKGT